MADEMTMDRVLQAAVERGDVAGVTAAAVTASGEVYQGAAGARGVDNAAAMTPDTVFWIASMTKAIVSTAAMQMVEQGKVGLDDDLGRLLPALAGRQVLDGWNGDGTPRLRPAKGAITLRRLLTHTAGFSYDMWNADIARYEQQAGLPGIISCENRALETPLVADPGTRWEYGINIDFAGKMVEALSGQRLDAYLQQHILGPLGMRDTGFKLRPEQRQRLASMHARDAGGALSAILFEIPQEPEFHMGGGGLYATAGDYLAFCRMILGGGTLDGAQVLRPETVALMARNHMGDLHVTKLVTVSAASTNDAEFFPGMPKKWGLGFMINTEAVAARRSAGSLSWAGLGNTYFWIDPTARVAGVVCTQLLPFADAAVLRLYDAFEAAVYRAGQERRAA